MAFELIMQTRLPDAPLFVDNFEELKREIAERAEKYRGLVYTEDNIKDAKADRAELNRILTTIDTRRKELKKEYAKPYQDFETRLNDAAAPLKSTIGEIDAQLEGFENQRKEQKQHQIDEYYKIAVPQDLRDLLPIKRIQDPKWLNKTVSLDDIYGQIDSIIERTRGDLLIISETEPEHAAAVRAKYAETLNVAEAIKYKSELRAAAEAIKRENPTASVNPAPAPSAPAVEPREPIAESAPMQTESAQPTEKLYTLRLEMQLTRRQADALKQFLADNEIGYTKI